MQSPISSRGPAASNARQPFLASVYGRIDVLAIFPMSGQPRPKAGARVRSVWSAPVTIFYAVASDESEVVVHYVIVGGRNLEAFFGPAP
jgi:plasmid stabilization system protein ParE